MFSPFFAQIHPWLPVLGLSVCAFIFNTTEFAPISLLSTIASDFDMREAEVGFMMTLYAWIVALISLPLMLFTRKIERKKLLLAILLFFITAHLLCMIAWNYEILLISRIAVAIAHAIFWSITASLAYRLAPKTQNAKALGFLATGSALAIVIGLPLGRFIGQLAGWRVTFGAIGVLALIMFVLLYRFLPTLPSVNAGSFQHLPSLFKRPVLIGIYLLTALVITAHFTAYSYIEPYVLKIALLGESFTTMVLFIFGIAGMLGSYLFARYRRNDPFGIFLIALGLLMISLLGMKLFSFYTFTFGFLCLLWGIAICLISLTLQLMVLERAKDATDVAMSLYSGIYNIGIGGGAFIGSIVTTHICMDAIGYIGFFFASFAFIFALWIWKRYLRYPL